MNKKILLFMKKDNLFCDYAEKLMCSYFTKMEYSSIRGGGESLSDEVIWFCPDYIISFLSPWILPENLLMSAKKAAINFHPGSPEYPGIGCYNFALYERASIYGITCHYMKAKVDSGDIIMTSYFDVSPYETVETLKLKSMNHMLLCFDKILNYIRNDMELPSSSEKWKREPFTRKQLEALCYIAPDNIDEADVSLRIKAVDYPSAPHGAYTKIGDNIFYYPVESRKPIV